MASFGWCLQEHQSIFLGKPINNGDGVSFWNLSPGPININQANNVIYEKGKSLWTRPACLKKSDFTLLLEISLVAHHQDHDGGTCECSCICQPVGQAVEWFPKIIIWAKSNDYKHVSKNSIHQPVSKPGGNVIHQQCPCCPSVITSRHTAKPLLKKVMIFSECSCFKAEVCTWAFYLARCVPNLKLDSLATHRNNFASKLDPNCVCAVLFKLPLYELGM